MGETSTAERLRTRLRELGWTQREFAQAIGVTAPVVCRILSGERAPSLETAFRIQKSAVAIPADAWISHSAADESGEHNKPSAEDLARAAGS